MDRVVTVLLCKPGDVMPAALPGPILTQAEQFLAAGWTVPAIADALGCSPATVRRHLRRQGIPIGDARSAPRRTFTTAEINAAAELYRNGATLHDVTKLLRTRDGTASQLLRSAGVTLRPPAHHPRSRRGGAA